VDELTVSLLHDSCKIGFAVASQRTRDRSIDYNIVSVRIPPEIDHLTLNCTVFGDINGDGKVNILDISAVAKAFGTTPGQPRWDQMCDVNYDFKVNILDISVIAREFGKSI
jgi:hypothetical protein